MAGSREGKAGLPVSIVALMIAAACTMRHVQLEVACEIQSKLLQLSWAQCSCCRVELDEVMGDGQALIESLGEREWYEALWSGCKQGLGIEKEGVSGGSCPDAPQRGNEEATSDKPID